MEKNIKIVSGDIEIDATLYNTVTAEAVYQALPLTAEAHRWGDEIYFSIPVQTSLEQDAKDVVEMGDIGYWPNGSAFCIFFGQTPVSRQGEIRPASAVNVFGKVTGKLDDLKQINAGTTITVKKSEP